MVPIHSKEGMFVPCLMFDFSFACWPVERSALFGYLHVPKNMFRRILQFLTELCVLYAGTQALPLLN